MEHSVFAIKVFFIYQLYLTIFRLSCTFHPVFVPHIEKNRADCLLVSILSLGALELTVGIENLKTASRYACVR